MPNRIANLQLQIPGGFFFVQPQTGWRSQRMASFETIVQSLILHRRGNAFLAQKHGWSTDPAAVRREVEQFNVRVCEQMGWTKYLTGDTGGAGAVPKSNAPPSLSQGEVAAAAGRVRKIWAGVRTINEWLDSKDVSVPSDRVERRAAICAKCPQNQPGDFTRWFTLPASEAIRRQLEKAVGRNLSTTVDSLLNLCAVCLCPLKLSVHVPLQLKLAHLSAEVEAELRQVQPRCWVIAEKDGK